jgi:hypothetical protein
MHNIPEEDYSKNLRAEKLLSLRKRGQPLFSPYSFSTK